jgi:hypothetical protein
MPIICPLERRLFRAVLLAASPEIRLVGFSVAFLAEYAGCALQALLNQLRCELGVVEVYFGANPLDYDLLLPNRGLADFSDAVVKCILRP